MLGKRMFDEQIRLLFWMDFSFHFNTLIHNIILSYATDVFMRDALCIL